MIAGETTAQPQQPAAPAATKPELHRPLNVLLVTDHLGHANGAIHGASRYYLQVLPRFDPARFNVGLCVLRERHPFAEALEREGVRPIFLNRHKWDPRALLDLLTLTRQMQIDVLHCLAMKGCLFGRIVGRLTGTPALIHLHDINEPGPVIGLLQRRIAPWTARALAVSDIVRDYTISRLAIAPSLVETLYNGLDLDAFARPAPDARQRIRRELAIPPHAFLIAIVGRIVPSKGQRLLIELLPLILRDHPEAHLLIVGEGPDLPHCRALADRLGISQAITFAGQRHDIPDVLSAIDVAAMPSLQQEGFGYAALEAAAAGRPVVAFEGGALHEMIEHDASGYIIPTGDSDAFTQALLQLARDPARARRMGRRGPTLARRFGIDQHIRRLQDIYSELALASPHTSPGARP
jgi:glycosyltransferase involved in cell wall biosynthesis